MMNIIYLLLFSSLLLLQYPQSSQSISINRLCGRFGHKCYGANWGKRQTSEDFSTIAKSPTDNNSISLRERMRWRSLQQRLHQLLELRKSQIKL